MENYTRNLSNSAQKLSIDNFSPKECLKSARQKEKTSVNLQYQD